MNKKSKTQTEQATPETEWPMRGGTYTRNSETGALTRLEDSDESVPGNNEHNDQDEDLNHGT